MSTRTVSTALSTAASTAARTAVLAACTALVTACGQPQAQPGGGTGGASGAVPASTTQAPTAGAGCSSGAQQLGPQDNGRTVCVVRGTQVVVRLTDPASPWSPVVADNAVVLTSQPITQSAPAGTTQAGFTANRTGTVHLSSHRFACPGSKGRVTCHAMQGYQVTVTVS